MRHMCLLPAALVAIATPSLAQDHQGHMGPQGDDLTVPSPMDHEAMGAGEGSASRTNAGEMDHSQMDHEGMSAMGGQTGHSSSAGPSGEGEFIPVLPPPPEAFEGPLYAAGEAVGADVMDSSRTAVMREISGTAVAWIQVDRAEYLIRQGNSGYLWDLQGYYGGDYDKFWFKSEGEGSFDESLESAEIQALWSHAIGPWWDLQTGLRQDLSGPSRTHAVVGVQGLAPYVFEVDAAAFISDKLDLTARIEAELDQRITQRLILQPRAELSLAAQDIPELGIGAGLQQAAVGLRLRYEISREFAPYFGIEQEWSLGGTADYVRADGEDASITNYVIGMRAWF